MVGEHSNIPQALSQDNHTLFCFSSKYYSQARAHLILRTRQSSSILLTGAEGERHPMRKLSPSLHQSLSCQQSHDGTSKPSCSSGLPRKHQGSPAAGHWLSAHSHGSPAPLGIPWKDDCSAQRITTEEKIQPPAKFSLSASSHGITAAWLCHWLVFTAFSPSPLGNSWPTPWQRGHGCRTSVGRQTRNSYLRLSQTPPTKDMKIKEKQGKGKVISSCLKLKLLLMLVYFQQLTLIASPHW